MEASGFGVGGKGGGIVAWGGSDGGTEEGERRGLGINNNEKQAEGGEMGWR